MPAVKTIGVNAFIRCYSLTSIDLPVVETIGSAAFGECSVLASVSFPAVKTIGSDAFVSCSALESVYILASSVCSLISTSAFEDTPIMGKWHLGRYGSIFVPESLVNSYKSADFWSDIADRITAYTGS
jgi:hypothetical protein